MTERQSGSSTQIMVAVIGVSGVVGAALIANWDKIFRTGEPAQAASSSGPGLAQPATAPSVPVDAARALGESQAKALQASAGALDGITAQIEAASAPAGAPVQPAITGWWRDGEGYAYRIEQQGSAFTFGQYQAGTLVGRGGGQVAGRSLNYGFESADGSRGKCTAEVAGDGATIAGRCGTGGPTWPFAITRAQGAAL